MPDTYDITMYEDETYSLTVTYQDANGAAIDLTGYTSRLQVKNNPNDSALFTVTSSDDMSITSATGTIALTITKTQSDKILGLGPKQYDLLITSGGGTKIRLLRGTIQCLQGITQP